MAISLFTVPDPKLKIIGTERLDMDASLSESHVYESDVTELEVEDGSDITDHVRNKPPRVNITGYITNTPLKIFTLGGVLGVDSAGSRTRTAFEALLAIREAKQPVTLTSGLRSYDNMLLRTFTVPREPGFGETFRFTAELRQARFSTSETVQIEAANTRDASAGTSDQVTSGKDIGSQAPVPPNPAQAAGSSFAIDLLKGVGLIN